MSRTPAAHLAQLKVAWPEWHIWRGERDTGYFAALRHSNGDPGLNADTPEELETRLLDWDKTRNMR